MSLNSHTANFYTFDFYILQTFIMFHFYALPLHEILPPLFSFHPLWKLWDMKSNDVAYSQVLYLSFLQIEERDGRIKTIENDDSNFIRETQIHTNIKKRYAYFIKVLTSRSFMRS